MTDQKIPLTNLKHVALSNEKDVSTTAVADAVDMFYHDAWAARQTVHEEWTECYAQYLGSPQSMNWLRTQNTRQEVIRNDWRHKIHMAKAHELVETFLAYLLSATFPNSQWFGLRPVQPATAYKLPPLEEFMRILLEEAELREETEAFYRQALIIGSSVMSLPWDNEYDMPKFETMDMFDFYPDPDAKNLREADIVRVIRKTRADIAQLVKKGKFQNLKPDEILSLPSSKEDRNEQRRNIKTFNGIQLNEAVSMYDMVDCMDYWGDLQVGTVTLRDVHCVVVGGNVVVLENNPFQELGKPFIFGTITEVPHIVYPRGILHPVLGELAMMDIVHNQTLDNAELVLDAMFTYVDDGVTDIDAIQTSPGNIIPVLDHDAIRRMDTGSLDSLGYIELDTLNQSIDRATGAGPMVSAGPGRGGERVTAAEIQATRDAGGNRLNAIHRHLERTFLMPLLKRTWAMIRKYRKGKQMVRILVGRDEGAYIEVTRDDFNVPFAFRVKGADHVVDREANINEILAYVDAVSTNPELAIRQNWDELSRRIAGTFDIFEDVDAVVQEPPPPPQPEAPQETPVDPLSQELQTNTPLTLGPEQMQYLQQTQGVEGLTDNLAPPSGFPPVP